MYRVGPSKVHRPEHLAFDGLILDKNDKFWLSHNPPNGWCCKCYTVAVSKERKERYEKEGIPSNSESMPLTIKIKAKTVSPKISYKTYINKRNGTISKVPGVCPHVASGVDPSFNFNIGNYSRDLVLFDDFMRKGKKDFPKRFEYIAETILRNEIKKEQFESFIEKAFANATCGDTVGQTPQSPDNNSKNITAVGFISSAISKYLKNKIGIDIGESVTVGLEARLLRRLPAEATGLKAKRHALKGGALSKSDADYILKCLLYGDVYFQKNNGYLIYLYKVSEDRYLQMSIKPFGKVSKRATILNIPQVRNIQFLNDNQVKSKYIKNKLLEVIK